MHIQYPDVGWQYDNWLAMVPFGEQLQDLHSGNPKYPVLHSEHVMLLKPVIQEHCPVKLLQVAEIDPREKQLHGWNLLWILYSVKE